MLYKYVYSLVSYDLADLQVYIIVFLFRVTMLLLETEFYKLNTIV